MPHKNLCANTLFHFTSSLDNIENILINDFSPNYCLENYTFCFDENSVLDAVGEMAVPLLSFCDIPLSQTINHINDYGGYAIGLTKDWGKKNNISPVLYTYPNSVFSITLNAILSDLSNYSNIKKDVYEKIIFQLLRFVKPYEGYIKKNGKKSKKKFYNEREWRYSPTDTFLKDNKLDLIIDKESFLVYKSSSNQALRKVSKLCFTPNDIKYIIVKKEAEILPIIDRIETIKGAKYSPDDVKKLITRVISSKQILEDF